jgi:16S rRNA (cytosine967-C5)-methyltransferase
MEPETAGLDARDAGLASAIYDAVVRRWLTLSAVLEHVLGRSMSAIEPPLRAVLLAGAAQLLLLDRIPDHAAVDESVELAKVLVRPKAAGLVNAGLRRVAGLRTERGAAPPQERVGRDRIALSDGRVLRLNAAVFPGGELELLAAATSHPTGLLRRWAGRWPADRVANLGLHGAMHAPTVLNTTFASRPLPDSLLPHQSHGHHVFAGTHAELLALLGSRRDLWVQDAASSRAVASAASLNPGVIVDVCAGQGTKTRQLAATFPHARVVATDADPERVQILRRLFADTAHVEVAAIDALLPRLAGAADLVLLDVPCSNTGVLARRPEARYRAGPAQLQRLTAIQRKIITDALPLLRRAPGGRVLYSTCSLELEENQRQAAWAAREHNLRIRHEEQAEPHSTPGDDPALYRDGAYSALLG